MDAKLVLQLRLITRIIDAYHTTRFSDVPAAEHVLSKGSVLRAFENLEEYSRRTA